MVQLVGDQGDAAFSKDVRWRESHWNLYCTVACRPGTVRFSSVLFCLYLPGTGVPKKECIHFAMRDTPPTMLILLLLLNCAVSGTSAPAPAHRRSC
jgi:hypothetical protein